MSTSLGTIFLSEILTLLLAGAIFIHAAFRLYHVLRAKPDLRNPIWIADVGWLLVAIFILTLWPNASYPAFYPRRSFLFFGAVAVFTAALAQRWRPTSRGSQFLKMGGRILLASGCLFLIFSAVRYLWLFRTRMFGPDFFYYVCTARHMASGFDDISLNTYVYFPGVYSFWRMILALTDGSLDSLQWSYLSVLVVNALLAGAIVQRVVRNIYAATIAVVWYIVFCSAYEGFLGVTEPIATLPVLIGLLAWGGKSFMGRSGVFRIFALGTGLGLALYIRQYAGLISLGAISLFISLLVQDKTNKIISFKRLILLVCVSAGVALFAILLEGYGLRPLLIGIQQMPSYGLRSNLWKTIWNMGRHVPLLSTCSIFALLVWLGCLTISKFRPLVVQPWYQMMGFTCIAGFLSLLSFIARSFGHYALFSGAMLIICSAIAFVSLVQSIPPVYKQHPLFYFLILLVALMPFVRTESRTAFYVWPIEKPVIHFAKQPWYLTSHPTADLASMKKHLKPLEKIYVLPPSQNEIHFFLGTRYSFYGWRREVSLTEVLQSPGLQGVIVMDRQALDEFRAAYADRMFQYDRADQILKQYQFKPVVELPTMTLWRKASLLNHQTAR